MPTYHVTLDDGREYEVEADSQPSHEEILSAIGQHQSSMAGAFGRGVAANAGKGLGAAGGAWAGATIGAEVGAFGGPLAEFTVPAGAVIGAGIGAFAGGMAGQKAQETIQGRVATEAQQQQLQQDAQSHPIASSAGSMVASLPSMLTAPETGVAGAFGKVVNKPTADILGKVVDSGVAGAVFGAGEAGGQVEAGQLQPSQVPGEIAKSAITMAPLGFLGPVEEMPAMKTLAGQYIAKPALSAATLATANTAYEAATGEHPARLTGIGEQTATNLPGFMAVNALASLLHGKAPVPKEGTPKEETIAQPETQPEPQPATEQPTTTEQPQPEPVFTYSNETGETVAVNEDGSTTPVVAPNNAAPAEEESAGPEATRTSIKNEATDQYREQAGLPPRAPVGSRPRSVYEADARVVLERNPLAGDQLIEELKAKPRPHYDWEAVVLEQATGLRKKAYEESVRAVNAAAESGDKEALASAMAAKDEAHKAYRTAIEVDETSGTATGRGLAARRGASEEFDSLASTLEAARAAQGGKPLTPAEQADITKKYDAYAKARDAAEAHAKEADETASTEQFKRTVADLVSNVEAEKKQAKAASAKEQTRQTLQTLREQARQRLREATGGEQPTVQQSTAFENIAEATTRLAMHVSMEAREHADKLTKAKTELEAIKANPKLTGDARALKLTRTELLVEELGRESDWNDPSTWPQSMKELTDVADRAQEVIEAQKQKLESLTDPAAVKSTTDKIEAAQARLDKVKNTARMAFDEARARGRVVVQGHQALFGVNDLQRARTVEAVSKNTEALKHFGLPHENGVYENGAELAKSALTKMATSKRLPPTVKLIASTLSKLNLKKFHLRIASDARMGYAGMWDPRTETPTITINTKKFGMFSETADVTFIHEVLHHVTGNTIADPKTEIAKQAVGDLGKLLKRAKAFAAANGVTVHDYRFSSVDEFVTGLFTDAGFQKFLSEIPHELSPSLGQRIRSLLSEAFRTIARMVTGKEVKPGSLLDKAFSSSIDLIREDVARAGASAKELHSLMSRSIDEPTEDHTIVGAAHIADGAEDFKTWAEKMREEFGPGIEPHLPGIFEQSKAFHAQVEDHYAQVAANAATPQGILQQAVEKGPTDTIDRNLAKKLAEAHIRAGAETLGDLESRVHADLQQLYPDITPRQARDAISDYGITSRPTPNVIKQKLQDFRRQAQLVSAIEDAKAGKGPLKTGFQRGKPSDEVRRLAMELRDTMREKGIQTTRDGQMADARTAVVSRLRNQIADLTRQLEGKNKPRQQREPVKYDAEMNALAKQRDELKSYLDDLTGPSPEHEWNQRAQAAAKASEEYYKRKIAKGDFERQRGPGYEASKTTEEARAQAKAAKDEWSRLREATGLLAKEAIAREADRLIKRQAELREMLATGKRPDPRQPKPTPEELKSLKAENERLQHLLHYLGPERPSKPRPRLSDDARMDNSIKYAERAIAQLERDIAGEERKRPDSPLIPNAKLRALRAEADSLRQVRDQMREAKIPKRDPEQVALDTYKKQLAKHIYDLEQRLKTGNFEKRTTKEINLDAKGTEMRATANRLQWQLKREMEKRRLAQLGGIDKVYSVINRWRRASLLSGYHIAGKLFSAAMGRVFVLSPLDESAGGLISAVFPKLAAKAPIEGGFSLRAEAKAAAAAFTETMKEIGGVLATGKSSKDAAFGKPDFSDLDPSWLDFFRHLHAALKLPAKEAEFARAYQKQAEWELRNGGDPTDPATQLKMSVAAYAKAKRAIFQQENFLTNAYRQAIGSLERSKVSPGFSKLGAAVGKFLLPIVHVPSNFAAEGINRSGVGLVRDLIKYKGFIGGVVDSLKPEEADAIMRHLKQGSVGGAMLVLGWAASSMFGGLYNRKEKRAPNDIKPGEVKVGDLTVPHLFTHSPLFEPLMVGATVRRVAESFNQGKPNGYLEGAITAAQSQMREVPFFGDQISEVLNGRVNSEAREIGNLIQSTVVPQGLRELAQDLDPMKGRKASTIPEHIQASIPVLRQQLPPKGGLKH